MQQPDPERATILARAAIAAAPAGLLTDMDGTLAPISPDPDAVRAAPGAADALVALGERLAVVAIISGRAASDVRRIAGSDEVMVVGNHGLEWLERRADAPTPRPELEGVPAAIEHALALVPDEPGVTSEHKGLSATVHFRNAPDPAAAAERVREALRGADLSVVTLRPGRMSIEVRPVGAGDKGSAVRELVERHGLRGVVVMGDDVTDLDMFRAVAELRDAGGLEAAILAVAGGREVPPEVRDAADALLPDPAAAVELLQALSRDASPRF